MKRLVFPDVTNGMYGLHTWHIQVWRFRAVLCWRWEPRHPRNHFP
jgi:hypothetical protein